MREGVGRREGLEDARRAEGVADLRLERVDDGVAGRRVDGLGFHRVVVRGRRGVGAHQIDVRLASVVEGRARRSCEAAARRVRRRDVDRVGGGAEAGDEGVDARAALVAAPDERDEARALAEAHAVAPFSEGFWSCRRRRAEGLEAGGDEDGDGVEAARDHEVARAAIEPARAEADRDRGGRARREDEGAARDAREAVRREHVVHRGEVGGAARDGGELRRGRAGRAQGEEALRGEHAAARGGEGDGDAARAPTGADVVEARDELVHRASEQGGGAIVEERCGVGDGNGFDRSQIQRTERERRGGSRRDGAQEAGRRERRVRTHSDARRLTRHRRTVGVLAEAEGGDRANRDGGHAGKGAIRGVVHSLSSGSGASGSTNARSLGGFGSRPSQVISTSTPVDACV